MKKKTLIPKRQSSAFGEDIYLLGEDRNGIKYWLESPTWDCGWYWGFGYVETYTNNDNPGKSKDIQSHSHISGFYGSQDIYDFEKQCFRKGEYIHNLHDTPSLVSTTFTDKEGWTLTELFRTFYHLRESAELFGRGGMHTTTNPCAEILTNKEWAEHINKVLIPKITEAIINILKP